MNCSCPKCKNRVTPDVPVIPAEGCFTKCPECNTGFQVRTESFARRALHKGDDISCANCGSSLGPSIYCPGCHALYPDYLVTESSSAASRQLGRILAIFKKSIKLGSKAPKAPSHRDVSGPEPKRAGIKLPGKPLQLAVSLVIVIACIGGGGFFYYQNKVETETAENYVRALFGIKSIRDLSIKVSTKVVTDWKNQPATTPRLSAGELTSLTRARADIDILMKRLESTPEKFAPSKAALLKLNDTSIKLQNSATSPAGSPTTYGDNVKKWDDEFSRTAGEVKSTMLPRITETFNASKTKYKSLQDF
jgi:hypothetical protein